MDRGGIPRPRPVESRALRLLLGGVVALAGCGAGGPGPAARPAEGPAAPARPVEVRLVDHEGLLREVERHRGKVVVLDCWSTSCPPCVKEFPGLVRLAATHGDRVACLSVAFDYDGVGSPEDLVPPVRAFLERVGAGDVVNLLSTEEADVLCRKLDLASVPAVYVWRGDGSLAVRYDDDMAAGSLGRPFTYDDVHKTVADLLAR